MTGLQWGKGRRRADMGPPPPTKRQRLAARVASERVTPNAQQREAHLRSLMGLPATPRRDPDGEACT
jgi:hypothetical protein